MVPYTSPRFPPWAAAPRPINIGERGECPFLSYALDYPSCDDSVCIMAGKFCIYAILNSSRPICGKTRGAYPVPMPGHTCVASAFTASSCLCQRRILARSRRASRTGPSPPVPRLGTCGNAMYPRGGSVGRYHMASRIGESNNVVLTSRHGGH